MEVNSTNISGDQRGSNNLEYQAFKLKKVIETRSVRGKSTACLKYAKGLEPIAPETEFRGTILTSLLPDRLSNDPNSRSNCEILMVVAMYNENSEHFENTMLGINQNIEYFHKQGIDTNKIACIIIIDGIKAFLEVYNEEKPFFSKYFDEEKVKQTFHVDRVEGCTIPEQLSHDEFAHCFMLSVTYHT